MSDTDSALRALERSARSVARLGRVIKILCVVVLFAAALFFLYALSRLDRRAEDFVAFGLLSVAMTAISLLVWAQVSFQATGVVQARLVASMQYDVEQLVRLAQKAARRKEHETRATPPLATEAPSDAAEVAQETPELGPATATLSVSFASSAEPAAAVPVEPLPHENEPVVPPTTRECPRCGETIRIDASRCKRCFEKV